MYERLKRIVCFVKFVWYGSSVQIVLSVTLGSLVTENLK